MTSKMQADFGDVKVVALFNDSGDPPAEETVWINVNRTKYWLNSKRSEWMLPAPFNGDDTTGFAAELDNLKMVVDILIQHKVSLLPRDSSWGYIVTEHQFVKHDGPTGAEAEAKVPVEPIFVQNNEFSQYSRADLLIRSGYLRYINSSADPNFQRVCRNMRDLRATLTFQLVKHEDYLQHYPNLTERYGNLRETLTACPTALMGYQTAKLLLKRLENHIRIFGSKTDLLPLVSKNVDRVMAYLKPEENDRLMTDDVHLTGHKEEKQLYELAMAGKYFLRNINAMNFVNSFFDERMVYAIGAICSKALPGAVSVEGNGGCGMMFRNDEDFKDSMMVFRKFMVSHLVSVTKHGRAPDASELTLKLDIEFPDGEKLRTEYATTKADIEKLVTDGKGFSGENLQEYSATGAKPLVMALNNLII